MMPRDGTRSFAAGSALVILLAGCAAKKTGVQSGADLSQIRRISVAPFDGPGGQAAADEFARQLVKTGLEVTDAKHPGGVILRGTVTEYQADHTAMVFLGNTSLVMAGGQTIVIHNPVVSVNSPHVVLEGSPIGASAQVASVSASVGVEARLVEASTGRAVWADRGSYEGLDLSSALEAVVSSLARSLAHVLPAKRLS